MSRKLLVICLATVAGLVMASSAMATLPEESLGILQDMTTVNGGNTAGTILNPEGKGDLLIFPYYDVREINGKTQDFYFAIVNDENDSCSENPLALGECHAGMAAKLRFREWDKSEEVFDVDIWMSRTDVWVGVLTHNTLIGLPYGTRITSPDYVITGFSGGVFPNPPGGGTFTVGRPFASGFDFPTNAYIPGPVAPYPTPFAPNSPGSNNLLGYIEVIGEENTFDHTTTATSGVVQRFGIGAVNCTPGPACWNTGSFDALNQLFGYAYVVRVADGASQAYNAKAIANFNVQTFRTLFSGPGGPLPTLLQCEDTLDELEFQLSKEEVFAGYSVEDAIAAKFSLILTFPTKNFHFCGRPNYSAKGVFFSGVLACLDDYPRVAPWTAPHANASEKVDVTIFDREEHRLSPPQSFISPTPQGPPLGLPYELNVIGLYKSATPPVVPALNNRDNVAFSTTSSTQSFDSGYIAVEFLPDQVTATPVSPLNQKITLFLNFGKLYTGYFGLPVLGLSFQEFSNNAVGGFYGDMRDVIYDTEWTGRIDD